MSHRLFRAVLFDLGGTLMHAREAWPEFTQRADLALAEYLHQQGIVQNSEIFARQFRRRIDEYYDRRERELFETTYHFILRELLGDQGHPEVPDEHLSGALESFFAVTQTNWQVEEDAISTLNELQARGYRLGMVSNAGDHKDVLQLTDRFGIDIYFDFILTSASCSYRKPHPRIFELALSHWYSLPQEVVMVGDTLEADILGAQRAGIYSIWAKRRANPNPDDLNRIIPDASLSSLSELPPLLERIQS